MKNRTYYFGFLPALDCPDWQNELQTSLDKETLQRDYELDYKNPFRPRLRRQLKKFEKNVNIGFNKHTIFVEKGKDIRELMTEITKALIKAGWQLGDFNRNGRVDDIWNETL